MPLSAQNSTIWRLLPGQIITRMELHALYGGSHQGGMTRSTSTPNILLFTEPKVGHSFGYFDRWEDDGCFHYTGMGQVSDQRMEAGNKAALNHQKTGHALRLFQGCEGSVVYVGEFAVDTEQPVYQREASDKNGDQRQVFVFRLRPIGMVATTAAVPPIAPPLPLIFELPVEAQYTERAFVDPPLGVYEIERREQKLVLDYRRYLATQKRTLVRHRVVPDSEERPLFTDLFESARYNLLEAKGLNTRENIRMAVGQLLDYSRFIAPKPAKAVLLPERPRRDLEHYVSSVGISTVWRVRERFEDNADGRFV